MKAVVGWVVFFPFPLPRPLIILKNAPCLVLSNRSLITVIWKENLILTEALTAQCLDALNEIGLPVEKMRAQGYDGASVMSGHINGVQTRIRRVNPKAVYIHCRAHVLNLCIVHDSKIPLVRNIMDTMQSVSLAFKFSAKRVLVFEEELGKNVAVREEMGRRTKLKALCETRWASRANCLDVFVTSFQLSAWIVAVCWEIV